MTTSWSRSPFRYSGDNVKTLHKLCKCCRWMRRSVVIRSLQKDCRNPHFGCAVLLISFTEVVGCILPSRLSQFVELHLLLPKPLNVLLYRFSDCAHHPAGFVIFAQLALLSLFIILIFPIFPSSELARSLGLSPIPTSISSNVFSGFLDVNPASSACVISSCSC